MKEKKTVDGGNGPEGIQSMYNFVSDPNLGLTQVAVRRIPCACAGCITQQSLLWDMSVALAESQPRYSNGTERANPCKNADVFQEHNDWKIVQLIELAGNNTGNLPSLESEIEDVESTEDMVLHSIEDRAAAAVTVGKVGAYDLDTPDENESFYLVTWLSKPYILQEDTIDPWGSRRNLPKGTFVAKAKYWTKIKYTGDWYVKGVEEDQECYVEMKNVIKADIHMVPFCPRQNKFPSQMKNTDKEYIQQRAI